MGAPSYPVEGNMYYNDDTAFTSAVYNFGFDAMHDLRQDVGQLLGPDGPWSAMRPRSLGGSSALGWS